MKTLFKYIGLTAVLLFSFYYTEKMSNIVQSNNSLVKIINENTENYNILPVSAEITKDYIIPGLNGYSINVLKSYNNMRYLETFNSYYLVYDKIRPIVSLENNKDKIIKYGNSDKLGVTIIVENNNDIINYASNKNIKITRLINLNTFNKKANYEQINNDYENYKKLDNLLNNYNLNKNICYVSNNIIDICKKNKKYLVESSVTLNNYNLASLKDNINSGYIIYINSNVSLTDFKILVKQIYYQNLSIISLSQMINEERD